MLRAYPGLEPQMKNAVWLSHTNVFDVCPAMLIFEHVNIFVGKKKNQKDLY